MKGFEFKGEWEFDLQLEAFKGFQSRRGSYGATDSLDKSNGIIKVRIEDKLDEDPDPLPEQIAAIDFLLENQYVLADTIRKKVKDEYPVFMEWYGADNFDDEFFPPVKTEEDIKNVIGVNVIHVRVPSKEGISYIGIVCGCSWDDEHGLGILMHKDRILGLGGADEAYNNWEAYKDNGTYEEEVLKSESENTIPPTYYEISTKYGKLKPSQQLSNDWYELTLIAGGFNEIFIDLIESGKRDVNYVNGNNSACETFLERAVNFQNYELIDYLLEKKADVRYSIQPASRNYDKPTVEKLLNAGASINELNSYGDTALSIHVSGLISQLRYKSVYQENDAEDLAELLQEIDRTKEFIKWLISKGADPAIGNLNGYDCFSLYLDEEPPIVKEVDSLLK